jgi:hypothetical protein
MPFDAAVTSDFCATPEHIAAQSALVLDMVEFYFRDGTLWTQRIFRRKNGKACLLGAVRFVRGEIRHHDDLAPVYLARAIRPTYQPRRWTSTREANERVSGIIIHFNDTHGRRYDAIAFVLRAAKALAEADAKEAADRSLDLFIGEHHAYSRVFQTNALSLLQ